jgi:hypothetical protein
VERHTWTFDEKHPGQCGQRETQCGQQQRVDSRKAEFGHGEVQSPDSRHQNGEYKMLLLHGQSFPAPSGSTRAPRNMQAIDMACFQSQANFH